MTTKRRIASIPLVISVLILTAPPQAQAQPNRSSLSGHIHPLARPENDRGRVSPALPLSFVTLTLAQSAAQQAGLDQLLSEQQTPGSPNYHRWLTPEEYAQSFGASQADVDKVVAWLQSQGLTIASMARGRNWIAVNGPAAQIENAFQTEIHEYVVNGETHFANATEPSVPSALGGVIRTIRGLHNFRPKPLRHVLKPAYTSTKGSHYLAPNDVATIYDVTPLYSAGINGSGQKLVIAGQTQINISDIQKFRSSFNLPANDPKIMLVPGSQDPGISSDDLPEADLDLEWSGAVARNATIQYVYASDVMSAVQYAIDQNLAPVVSTSYGLCEPEMGSSEASTLRSFAKQGNAQGITWISSAGDNGGADCDDSKNPGLAVDLPASIPEVTALGGTEFNEGSGDFWKTANDANQASAISYIPERVWNDSATDGEAVGGGGGVSVFFSKPSWQTGPGVPGDNARHVPDVSLSASADHDGYLVYTSGTLEVFGGTSVSAPAFAGMTTLVNHYLVSSGAQSTAGLGNMNPALYALAQSAPSAFHDVTVGDNIVTVACASSSRSCTSTPVGFSAGVGYDSASGLGSVDAFNLATKWSNHAAPTAPTAPAASITLLSNMTSFRTSDVVFLTATAAGSNNVTPVGAVQFQSGGAPLGSANLVGSAGVASATLALNGSQLPMGSVTITAVYTESGSSSATASITVNVTPSTPAVVIPTISGLTNGASFKQSFAPGMILSVFGSQLAPSTQSASSVPLPISMAGVAATVNDVAAPLFFVSPGQLNIQVPYETPMNSTAVLKVNNNGQVASLSFFVSATAPGVFVGQNSVVVPNSSVGRGQAAILFVTGAGNVTPPVPTAAAPAAGTAIANLPRPAQTTTMTIGGVNAPIQFIGIPSGLVGVIQINFVVPSGIATGLQNLVVTTGGVASSPVKIGVTQ
jgi:uncharacterized protein (TIGR03437 family)